MTDPVIFKIEDCQLRLALVDTSAVGYQAGWQAPGGANLSDVTVADYDALTALYSCQVTSAALTASPQVTNETVPATGCAPAKTIPTVGETSFSLDVSYLQDLNVAQGIAKYLFEHDTKEAYFFLGFSGTTDPPKAIGRVRLVVGNLGGGMRALLSSDVSFPCSMKPDFEFGTSADSDIVPGSLPYKGAAVPGDIFAAEPTITAESEFAELAALGYVAVPATAWTTGQKITIGTFNFNWSGSAWAAGAHA